jgi:hypothetical protein
VFSRILRALMWYRILPLCFLMVLVGACRCRTPAAVGLYPIKLSNGSCVYLKREVRGLSYDAVGNGDPCVALSPERDYIYSELGPFDVYYTVSDREITLYSTSDLTVPPNPSGGVQVRNVKLLPLRFRDFRETTRRKESHACWFLSRINGASREISPVVPGTASDQAVRQYA